MGLTQLDATAVAATATDIDTVLVTGKRAEADGVVSLRLERPDGARLPDWAPGAHIDLLLPTGVTRQYSLCGDRWDANSYRVGVLREHDGRGASAWIHDELAEGDLLSIGGPRNHFPVVPAQRYLFIAGGIGVTPMLPMIHQAELLGVRWELLYGGRTRASMAFLGELARYGDRVDVRPQDEYGLLELDAHLRQPLDGCTVYCCGPAPLLDAVTEACRVWPAHTLHIERFAAKERAAPARQTPFEVELRRSGTTVTVPPNMSVLDVMERAGVTVLSSCREGTCGTCETAVLDGTPDHRDSILGDGEREAGDCLFPCVSRSCTDRLVLDV